MERVGYITYVDQLDAYYESTRGNFSVTFFSKSNCLIDKRKNTLRHRLQINRGLLLGYKEIRC